ncbi:MAG: hypothetical protein HC833_11520 [Leptolyngbyaceae cyanobacterium RM1_406_9]|nr:hypothetical protein [Leptolyngbyaceae cyanobacterium SM1_4_3]NJN90098.1 hypothetical protein [Leptolyngbyaceae cyanobacterium SL_5_14]NJO74319.1 hypothetical protein [Leptolyngbyaceae cyanobacterium RM1_406_9]
MAKLTCTVPIPQTPQELEQAIRYYTTNDLSENELFYRWQAIRDASLEQQMPEPEMVEIAGDDSY